MWFKQKNKTELLLFVIKRFEDFHHNWIAVKTGNILASSIF
jgi:hypothetical protein